MRITKERCQSTHQCITDGHKCSSNRRRKPQQIRNLQQLPIGTSNKVEPLVNLNDGNGYPRCLTAADLIQVQSNHVTIHQGLSQSVKKINNIGQNIVIIGNSHARKCAAELEQNLSKKCAVSSYVKRGAGMSAITHTVKE